MCAFSNNPSSVLLCGMLDRQQSTVCMPEQHCWRHDDNFEDGICTDREAVGLCEGVAHCPDGSDLQSCANTSYKQSDCGIEWRDYGLSAQYTGRCSSGKCLTQAELSTTTHHTCPDREPRPLLGAGQPGETRPVLPGYPEHCDDDGDSGYLCRGECISVRNFCLDDFSEYGSCGYTDCRNSTHWAGRPAPPPSKKDGGITYVRCTGSKPGQVTWLGECLCSAAGLTLHCSAPV